MSWQYYTMDSHTLKEKTSAWAPNANKVLTRVPMEGKALPLISYHF